MGSDTWSGLLCFFGGRSGGRRRVSRLGGSEARCMGGVQSLEVPKRQRTFFRTFFSERKGGKRGAEVVRAQGEGVRGFRGSKVLRSADYLFLRAQRTTMKGRCMCGISSS